MSDAVRLAKLSADRRVVQGVAMTEIIYLHGFLSSPQSYKARVTSAWLGQKRPDCRFQCPQISSYPSEAKAMIDQLIAEARSPLKLIGSSLGGYWASYIVERTEARAVLINPATAPYKLISSLVGQPLKNYYTDHSYTLTPACEQLMAQLGPARPTRAEAYWLLVQTGDETLDYREATAVFERSKQTVIEGGNHAFEHYQNYLPAIYEFLVQGE